MREVRREAHEIFLSFIIKMSTKLIAIEHELFNPQVERLVSQARVWRESMSLFYELREVVQRFMDQVFSLLRFLQLLSLLSLLPLFRRRAARDGATLQGRYDLNASIMVTARTRIFPVQGLMLSPSLPPSISPSLPPSTPPPLFPPPPSLPPSLSRVSICVCVRARVQVAAECDARYAELATEPSGPELVARFAPKPCHFGGRNRGRFGSRGRVATNAETALPRRVFSLLVRLFLTQ